MHYRVWLKLEWPNAMKTQLRNLPDVFAKYQKGIQVKFFTIDQNAEIGLKRIFTKFKLFALLFSRYYSPKFLIFFSLRYCHFVML